MQLNTYLNYGGNCEQALRFYEKHLGGKIVMMMKHGDVPEMAAHTPPNMKNSVLHARIMLGGSMLMASDAMLDQFQPMRSAYLALGVSSDEEAERVHKLLADGGEVFMPMQATFFASRFSMLRDQFGTSWMILHERPMQPGA